MSLTVSSTIVWRMVFSVINMTKQSIHHQSFSKESNKQFKRKSNDFINSSHLSEHFKEREDFSFVNIDIVILNNTD